jgi:hypothetical protein
MSPLRTITDIVLTLRWPKGVGARKKEGSMRGLPTAYRSSSRSWLEAIGVLESALFRHGVRSWEEEASAVQLRPLRLYFAHLKARAG